MRLAARLYAAFLITMYVAGALLIFFIRGQSDIWVVLTAYAGIAVAVGWVAVRPPRAWPVVAVALTALAVVAIRADAALAVLVVGAMGCAAYGIGSSTVRQILADRAAPGVERLAYELAIGIAILAYATLALGLAGFLTRPAIGALYVAVLMATSGRTLASLRRAQRALVGGAVTHRASVMLLLGCSWVVLLFIEAVAPELQYDSLSYHLGLPRVWIEAGRLVDVPEQPQSYLYQLTEMSYASAMLFGGQTAAKLVSLGLFGVGCAGLFGWMRAIAGQRSAAVATLLYVATPVVAWEATTTSIDATLATYVLLAVIAAHRSLGTGDTRWAVLAGVLSGCAIATKVTAVTALVPLVALVSVMAMRRDAHVRRIVPTAVLAATVVAMPWPTLRYLQTGNPVFPLFNAIFRSPQWPPVSPSLAPFGIGYDPWALIRLPIAVSFDAQTFTEAMRGPVIGLGLLALPLAVPAVRRTPELRFVAMFSIAAFVGWAVTAQQLRYLVPVLPLLAALMAAAIADLARTMHGRGQSAALAIPAIVVLAGVPLYLGTLWNIPERIPIGVAMGLETRAAYLGRILPTYGAFAALSQRPNASATRVVLISKDDGHGDDEDRLYAPGQVETFSSLRARDLYTSADETVALAWLREHGVTHVLLDHDGTHTALSNLAISNDAFLRRIGTPIYTSGPVVLYELHLP